MNSTVGPISIAAGATTTQTVEAYNVGDGVLTPRLKSSVPWITTSVAPQRACSSKAGGQCIPLLFTLSAAGLPAGASTGIVTVTDNDPNAVDTPQTITVTLQVGGAVPASVDVYVAPGGTQDIRFSTNNQINGTATTQDGGRWLSLSLDGSGTFQFSYPYRIHIAPSSTMGFGTYTGKVVTSGSSFAADNKTIPVTMRVTQQPIAQGPTGHFYRRLAQGAPPLSDTIPLTSVGQGTLTVQTVTATMTTGTGWLTAATSPAGAAVTFDPGTLSPAVYSGTVTINSNAVNGSITVPVDFEVVAKGPPLINFQGVQDNGTFVPGDPVSPGDIAVVKGEQLSFAPVTLGQAPPLATQIGGAQVMVNGAPAPMYYSTYGQLAFQVPYEIPLGTAVVRVQRDDGQSSNLVSVQVVNRAPRLLLLRGGPYGAITNPDGTIPAPVGTFSDIVTHPAQVGDTLVLYAIGLGSTSPSGVTGQPAPSQPLAQLTKTPTVNFGGGIGGTDVTPLFAGLSPTYAGLYQVNVTIPSNVPHGIVNLSLAFSDSASNTVQIAIQ